MKTEIIGGGDLLQVEYVKGGGRQHTMAVELEKAMRAT